MVLGLLELEPGFEHTKNSCMLGMPQESWVERTLVEAQVELEIQVVPKISIAVGDYEMPKQPPHQSDFYADNPALVVVVDPLSTKQQLFNIDQLKSQSL